MSRTSRRFVVRALITFASSAALVLAAASPQSAKNARISTIAFVSTRDDPPGTPNPLLTGEIYLMNADGTNTRRLTYDTDRDALPALSPDGKGTIVFDSNRLRPAGEPVSSNISHLFLMNRDGSKQRLLTRGSSGTWSPDGRKIAFHASASGTGLPIKPDPGAATTDSDIFVLDVEDLLDDDRKPKNITNSAQAIDDDPDWSPDGKKIVFMSHDVNDDHSNPITAEMYVMNANGRGEPKKRLTYNAEEERAPDWSPDGTRIVFMCRRGQPLPGGVLPTFEICVMNADGTDQTQLTVNSVGDLTPSWSPDGQQIVFHRPVAGQGNQLWMMNANDGTGQTQLTSPPGINLFANWGEIKVRKGKGKGAQ
jgi:TolB protein